MTEREDAGTPQFNLIEDKDHGIRGLALDRRLGQSVVAVGYARILVDYLNPELATLRIGQTGAPLEKYTEREIKWDVPYNFEGTKYWLAITKKRHNSRNSRGVLHLDFPESISIFRGEVLSF